MFGLVATPARAPSALDAALASLSLAVAAVRRAASVAPADAAICASLRAADLLTATVVGLLGRGDLRALTGMDPVTMLQLDARRTYTDARMLLETSSTLSAMPATAARFEAGTLSYAEVRSVVCAVRPVGVSGRTVVDQIVGSASSSLTADDLLGRVDAAAAGLRPDLERAREDRSVARSFLSIQGRIDGGSSFYGEADALSTATLVEALDARADSPMNADDPDAPSRAQQHLDALISICEDSLAGRAGGVGGAGGTRPRPRFLVTLDLDAYAAGDHDAGRLMRNIAGPAPRISPLSLEMLLCDADVVPVLFRLGRPVGVGDAKGTIPRRLRRALIARDGGCRFPGCRAPVGWSDAHHAIPRAEGGATDEGNCLLLCRRHHRYVHRYGWKVTIRPDGVVAFRYRGRSLETQPARRMRA